MNSAPWLKRQAVLIVSQLPEDQDQALAVLEFAKEFVLEFMTDFVKPPPKPGPQFTIVAHNDDKKH